MHVMKSSPFFITTLVWLLALGWSHAAMPPGLEWPDQFSADQVMTTPRGSKAEKIFVDGGKSRSEARNNEGGLITIGIVRYDQNKVYGVDPSRKRCTEMAINSPTISTKAAMTESHWELMGSEVVNGVKSDKYKVTNEMPGRASSALVWFSQVTKVPVRMFLLEGNFTCDWSNLKKGPQDPKLFEPPEDYKKLILPSSKPVAQPPVTSPSPAVKIK
jgi:hypothetical protein